MRICDFTPSSSFTWLTVCLLSLPGENVKSKGWSSKNKGIRRSGQIGQFEHNDWGGEQTTSNETADRFRPFRCSLFRTDYLVLATATAVYPLGSQGDDSGLSITFYALPPSLLTSFHTHSPRLRRTPATLSAPQISSAFQKVSGDY